MDQLMKNLTSFREMALPHFARGDWSEFERLAGALPHVRGPREAGELLGGLLRFLDALTGQGGGKGQAVAGLRDRA